MMEAKDWISGLVGLIIFCLGLFPLLNGFGTGPEWFSMSSVSAGIFSWIAAVGGFYLIINSVIEITNSNIVGGISFFTALAITAIGVLKIFGDAGRLTGFLGMAWVSPIIFQILFIALGLFLMIATFAMEL